MKLFSAIVARYKMSSLIISKCSNRVKVGIQFSNGIHYSMVNNLFLQSLIIGSFRKWNECFFISVQWKLQPNFIDNTSRNNLPVSSSLANSFAWYDEYQLGHLCTGLNQSVDYTDSVRTHSLNLLWFIRQICWRRLICWPEVSSICRTISTHGNNEGSVIESSGTASSPSPSPMSMPSSVDELESVELSFSSVVNLPIKSKSFSAQIDTVPGLHWRTDPIPHNLLLHFTVRAS